MNFQVLMKNMNTKLNSLSNLNEYKRKENILDILQISNTQRQRISGNWKIEATFYIYSILRSRISHRDSGGHEVLKFKQWLTSVNHYSISSKRSFRNDRNEDILKNKNIERVKIKSQNFKILNIILMLSQRK